MTEGERYLISDLNKRIQILRGMKDHLITASDALLAKVHKLPADAYKDLRSEAEELSSAVFKTRGDY
jgi:hypothetical protein